MTETQSQRQALNAFYAPLDAFYRKLLEELKTQHKTHKIESGFYNGHYYKNQSGEYERDAKQTPGINGE